MAFDAFCGIHPLADWSRRFSVASLHGRRTRPSRELSAQAHFQSSQSCVCVQRCNDAPQAGPWPLVSASVHAVESWGLAAAVALVGMQVRIRPNSPNSNSVRVRANG